MDALFETIVSNLKDGNSISEITNEIKLNISNGILNISDIFFAFIKYLKSNYLNKNNSLTFEMIDEYFNNKMSLKQLSQALFLKKVIVDQDKRDGYQPQFLHKKDETFLDEIFRVIYEFTRNDLITPKGVCYDFCLFIIGISFSKKDIQQMYIWNSIESGSGENNFILFCVEKNDVFVYDPFNGVYLPLDKYNIANVGSELIELNNINLLKESFPLTSFDFIHNNIKFYNQIQEMFKTVKSSVDDELNLLRTQNYYQRLGVDRNASFDEIKSSFRRIISKFHPDINPNDECATEKTQLIVEAYECLKSDVLRKEYDSKIIEPVKETKEEQRPSNSTNVNISSINFDEEIERIIREFKKKYHVDSYEDILKLLTEMSRQTVRQEFGKSDLKYNNIKTNYYKINNIYDSYDKFKKYNK